MKPRTEDELCLLLHQLTVSPSPSPTESPSNPSPTESSTLEMSVLDRLDKLVSFRTEMRHQLSSLLLQRKTSEGKQKEEIEGRVEEYRDLLDGVEVLIQRLFRTWMEMKDEEMRTDEQIEVHPH